MVKLKKIDLGMKASKINSYMINLTKIDIDFINLMADTFLNQKHKGFFDIRFCWGMGSFLGKFQYHLN